MPLPSQAIRVLTLASLTCGCADELTPETASGELNGRVVTEMTGEGRFMTRVDASEREAWVYFSFDTGAEVSPADPASSSDWDLGFQRFNIISNGGASGTGGAMVAVLDGESLENVRQAPAEGFVADQPDSDDDDSVVDSAFALNDGWYDYDGSSNTLSPKPIVYVVLTGSGVHYALELLDYYDEVGTSAHPSFAWSEVPAP